MAKKTKKEKGKKEKKRKETKEEESRKKRLLIATDNFLPRWDGIARFLSEIIPRLKYKYDITIIAPDFGPCEAEKDKVIRLVKMPITKFRIGDFNPARFDYKTIKREVRRADIVFSQTIGSIGMLAIITAKRNRKKVISFIHSIEWELVARAIGLTLLMKYLRVLTKFFVRKIYNKSSLLIVPSENIAEMLTWQKIKTKKKVIHLGVDTKKFVPVGNKI
nr:glycosyltransferase [Nanoarchaeota archaeon]